MHMTTIREACIVGFFLTAFSVAISSFAAEVVSVKGDTVNLRSGPGLQHQVKWKYGSGFPLEIMKKENDWLQVRDFEDETGWIHTSHINAAAQVIVKANKGQEEAINIRSGPGSENAVIGSAYYGVVFSVLEIKAEWVKVKHESGFSGWVNKSLLWGF